MKKLIGGIGLIVALFISPDLSSDRSVVYACLPLSAQAGDRQAGTTYIFRTPTEVAVC